LKELPNAGTAFIHFYCSFQDPESQDPSNVFGSFLSQLCRLKNEHWPEIESLYHHKETDHSVSSLKRLSLRELEVVLERVLPSFSEIFVLLDAPNESPSCSLIISTLTRLAQTFQNMKVFIASTPETEIAESIADFPGALTVSITPEMVSSDIRTVVDAQIEKLPKLRSLSSSLKGMIRETLVNEANGM
jgi:hypothetical protein